ncbi:site-specific DNA-methyltransferase [Achromobacter xylosoxidans]|uniref:DNA-methyltransferase n=1 Tax=Alcaligenes xylosoxydans xylosoxydans TaxID=85698 RepID=UPI00203FE3AC|nr:site-specific DNA-methyltransferase [Achromobacter xylosoxidans]MCM2569749.1 site-specific DNA-methyltransferase [Achromobacter xylosoxidans]
MRYTLHHGDCIEAMGGMADASVDAIVTDPPYELGFMGKSWDSSGVSFCPEVWRETLRVLKPGGHLLAFSGSRTYHRLAAAIEDAGFEIRDQIMWIYGSGFPKSHNLDGAWDGWGTALKPAHEPICVARKPLTGTVAANVLAHGTGALNIDGCRVEHVTVGDGNLALNPHLRSHINGGNGGNIIAHEADRRVVVPKALGRWPANVIHDGSEEVLQAFPDAPGQLAAVSTAAPSAKTSNVYGAMRRDGEASADSENHGAVGFKMRPGARRLDAGSAARFFYCAKASRADRNDGLDSLPDRAGGMKSNTSGQHITRRDGRVADPVKNHHPTVKPTDLMRYLCRLVTPPGGLVLDPFMGSGSTGKAAILEGFRFIGCELQAEYIEIARARIQNSAAEQHQYELEIA